jgi:hypothetical protein
MSSAQEQHETWLLDRGRPAASVGVTSTSAAGPSSSDGIDYLLWRHVLADGLQTTLYAVRHPRRATRVRVVHFARMRRLDVWCAANGAPEAIVGGFFLRDPYRPLGELWLAGRVATHAAVAAPYGPRRACVVSDGDGLWLVARGEAPAEPSGDLLQAGPMLVADGAVRFDPDTDEEGFSRGAAQFDSDITLGRYPRAALGMSRDTLVAVACDGRRSGVDAGLSMLELAQLTLELGCEAAINLDGGGSTTLVHRAHLLNRPYSTQDQPAPQSRRIVSALVFDRRG